jgi:hypothetical protein
MHAVGSALSLGSFRIRDTIPVPGNNDPSNFPVVHLPGGTGEEALINWLFGALALAALVWALSVAIRERKFYALAMFVGAALASSAEPLIDVLLHVVWPKTETVFFTVYGREIPPYLTFGWILYFFPLGLWIIKKIERGDFATLQSWRWLMGGILLKTFVFEWLPITRRWWMYYGDDQPLMLYRLPMHWIFINTCAITLGAVMVYVLKRFAFDNDDRYSPVFAFVYPMSLVASYFTMNAPVGTLLNATDNLTLVTLGAVATILLCVFTLEMCGRVVVGSTQADSLSFLRPSAAEQPVALPADPVLAGAAATVMGAPTNRG